MAKPKLTAKQQRFVEEYCSNGFNATQAAITAGYSKKTAQEQGSQTLSNLMVQSAIQEFMDRATKRAEITVDDLIKELDENRRLALDVTQVAAANQATMGKAKLLGLDVQKVDHQSSDGSMTPTVIKRVVIDG